MKETYLEMDNMTKAGPTIATAEDERPAEAVVDASHIHTTRRLEVSIRTHFLYSISDDFVKRFIGFLPILAFASTTLGSWEGVAAGFAAGLENGGPVALVWGYLMAVFGALALAASIAEMASMFVPPYPYSEAQSGRS